MRSLTRVKQGERLSWSRNSSERKMKERMSQYLRRETGLVVLFPWACWRAWYAGTRRQSNTFSRRLVWAILLSYTTAGAWRTLSNIFYRQEILQRLPSTIISSLHQS